MCLIAKNLPEKCKKTIVVYKELVVSKFANDIDLGTPFRGIPIVSPLMIAKPILSKEYFKKVYIGISIGEGFIHSFKKYQRPFYETNIVVKAYIPKGAIYITGIYDIASTKLILDPRDIYKQTGYKFPLSDRIKFFLWRIIHLIK